MKKERIAPCPECGEPFVIIDWSGSNGKVDFGCNKCGIFFDGRQYKLPRITEDK